MNQHPTHQQLQAAIAAGEPAPQLQLQLAARDVRLDAGARTITGTVARYSELVPSHQIVLEPGSLTPRQPLSRVKLLRDHNHADPVGYMTAFDADTLEATFYVPEGENGDRALREAADQLRDGFSVGFTILRYEFDAEYVMHVHDAEFYETSLVAVPAIASAGVTNVAATVATNPPKEHTNMTTAPVAAQAADTPTPATLATQAPTEITAELTTPQPAPQPQPQNPMPLHTHERGLSFAQVVDKLTAAAMTSNPETAVQLALNTILPSADAGEGFLRDDWIGELFRASDERRPWIDAIGTPQQLTNYKGTGWAWKPGESPEVEEYAGGNTTSSDEVASNPVSTIGKTFTAFDIAAAWEIKRRYTDFADPEFTQSFWRGVMADYKRKSNAGVRTRVLAAAAAPGAITAAAGGTATVSSGGVTRLIKQLTRDVRKIEGGRANRIFLSTSLMEELEDYAPDNVPMWLAQANIGMDFEDGRAQIAGLAIVEDSTLTAGQAVAFDSRALMVRERTPLELDALSIPQGKVQLGFYSYLRLDPHDERLIVKRTYGEALPTS